MNDLLGIYECGFPRGMIQLGLKETTRIVCGTRIITILKPIVNFFIIDGCAWRQFEWDPSWNVKGKRHSSRAVELSQ